MALILIALLRWIKYLPKIPWIIHKDMKQEQVKTHYVIIWIYYIIYIKHIYSVCYLRYIDTDVYDKWYSA